MTHSLSRREAVAASLLAGTALATTAAPASAQTVTPSPLDAQLAELEGRYGGRLGASIVDLATGQQSGHRADERFLLMSTFKALAAGFVLARVDNEEEQLDRRIAFEAGSILPWSPVTKHHTGGAGMTVADLCAAIVTWSDNTAGNLILDSFGGPQALTGFLRRLGDEVTRLDRIELGLNTHEHDGDERDTTSPAAMAATLRTLLFGNVLSGASRNQLTAWLITSKTGGSRLRAGLPSRWLVGNKTGTNTAGVAADVGVAWPIGGGPLIITAYCDMPERTGNEREAVIAEVSRIAAQGILGD
jgi:beta-lactamase class A